MLTLIQSRTTPVLLQWRVKDPCHSAKIASDRLHLNTQTTLTQQSRSGLTMPLSWHSRKLSGNELLCNLSGNLRPQSFQIREPLWTDPSLKSEISVLELISTLKKKKKKKKKRRWRMNGRTFPRNPLKRESPKILAIEEKATSPPPCTRTFYVIIAQYASCVCYTTKP